MMPFIPWPWKRPGDARSVPAVVAPFVLYSCVCTAILVLWPGFTPALRHADRAVDCRACRHRLGRVEKSRFAVMRRIMAIVLSLLVVYQVLLVVVIMPLFADRFGETRLAGEAIGRTIRAAPAPVYGVWLDTDVLFYVEDPVATPAT